MAISHKKAIRGPYFVIAGMPRGATTFLYHNLQKHPTVYLPFRKETNYFVVNYSRGINWYLGLYRDMRADQIGGDISPLCFMSPGSAERINEFRNDMKVILSIRDPVEWVLSFYSQFRSFTFGMASFEDFIDGYTMSIGKYKIHLEFRNNKVLRTIEEFQKIFKDNLLIFKYDLLKKNPLSVLKLIENFLNLDSHFDKDNFDNFVINASGRGNNKLIEYLLSRESIITFMQRMLPHRLVRVARGYYNLQTTDRRKEGYPEKYVKLAVDAFGDQRNAILNFFGMHDVLLGTNEPLRNTFG